MSPIRTRLLATTVAAILMAGPALAQTSPGAPTAAGRVNATPSSPPPVNGPTQTPSAAGAAGRATTSPTQAAPARPAPATATPTPMSPSASGPPASGPPASGPMAGGAMAGPTVASNPSVGIVDTLTASGQFTVLVKGLNASGLAAVLRANGPLTVFAPTDRAFAALPPGVLATLQAPANAQMLQDLLKYHVVNAKLSLAAAKGSAATPVTTVAGTPVTVSGLGDPIKVGSANLIQADVVARNGLIQVIDAVLLPPGMRLPASGTTGAPAAGMTPSATAPASATPRGAGTPAAGSTSPSTTTTPQPQ